MSRDQDILDSPLIGLHTIKIHAGREDQEDQCHTPSSPEHKIRPAMLSCPPAPKKPKRKSRNKKFSNLQFFETMNGEEVEMFFQSSFKKVCFSPRVAV
ncbi:hypothetical protein Tsubulata_050438 [Turnera subulata]|uniref:Uncharacterized protein n=1 Tax=Turnera subulata TaxID=218843 RepID=A0A9Q0FGG6_9ROSI|nr:hypothetical protein Tsubulata_050438 [Turnera subulata]